MSHDVQNKPATNSVTHSDEMAEQAWIWDLPSILMVIAAVVISMICFWPTKPVLESNEKPVSVGLAAPGLWCVDATTGQPALGLVPRGWFTWLVISPAHLNGSNRLDQELQSLEKQWQAMADLDRWRRVVIVTDPRQAEDFLVKVPQPAMIPFDAVLGTARTWKAWGSAERVRHILIEPSGRILMIEPAEMDQPGSVKRIAEDLRRRLQTWEGEFDDLPRFS
jgi:hypothetical protein